MKRVLVISYYWPPTGGSGVQRWVKFSKYFPQLHWQPVIYTALNPEQISVDESLLSDVPPEAEVIKRRIFEPYGIYRKFAGKKSSGEVNPINSQRKTLKQKLSVWIRGNLFVPDPRIFWVKPSVKFLTAYLREHPVDAIVTTGPPHSMHLIGRGVMRSLRALGSPLPRWIADFRDPWTEMFYFKHMSLTRLSASRHKRLEQSVLDECDVVVSVSPPVRDDFALRTDTPVRLITNGFDDDDFVPSRFDDAGSPSDASYDTFRFEGKFVVAHTGLFASDGNPVKLWESLSRRCGEDVGFRKALRIVLAGKTDGQIIESIKAAGLGDNIVDFGYLPHNQIVCLQRRADVLMLPLRREPEYAKVLPGKIFEYLASRRPVLGIGQMDSASSKVLESALAGSMYDWHCADDFYDFIGKAYASFLSGARFFGGGDISGYSRRFLAGKMVELFEQGEGFLSRS